MVITHSSDIVHFGFNSIFTGLFIRFGSSSEKMKSYFAVRCCLVHLQNLFYGNNFYKVNMFTLYQSNKLPLSLIRNHINVNLFTFFRVSKEKLVHPALEVLLVHR